jgi:hypothetical protein
MALPTQRRGPFRSTVGSLRDACEDRNTTAGDPMDGSGEDDLTQSVREALSKSGMPFEMAVARECYAAGLFVNQSRYVTDPSEGKAREVDVEAIAILKKSNGYDVSIHLVIECKYVPDAWALLRSDDEVRRRESWDRIATDHGVRWLNMLRRDAALSASPFLQTDRDTGYALCSVPFDKKAPKNTGQAERAPRGEQGLDRAYQAVMQATKAAAALKLLYEDASVSNTPSFALFFPVVAVRGPLFAARLDDAGEIHVDRIERGRLFWRNPSSGTHAVLVDVVTEHALPAYVGEFTSFVDGCIGSPGSGPDDLSGWASGPP